MSPNLIYLMGAAVVGAVVGLALCATVRNKPAAVWWYALVGSTIVGLWGGIIADDVLGSNLVGNIFGLGIVTAWSALLFRVIWVPAVYRGEVWSSLGWAVTAIVFVVWMVLSGIGASRWGDGQEARCYQSWDGEVCD